MAYSGNFYHPLAEDLPDYQWKTPLSLAVGLHLFVLILSLLPASLFHRRPELPEVITINLFNAAEVQKPKRAEPKKRQPPKSQPKKIPPKKSPPPPSKKPATSIAPPTPPPAVVAPKKLTSLTPRKIKKKTPPPPEEPKRKEREDKRLKALDRIQARVNKKTEDQKLKHDLAKLRESLHIKPQEKPAPPAETIPEPAAEPPAEINSESSQDSAPSSGSTELMDMALKRYYIAVSRRIHNHWVLPEMQNWDESLEALMVVVVRDDGAVIKSFFEKKSSNAYFNQFVEKTIKEASPLPQFPADLKKPQLEIGLRFHPSGLF